MATKNLPAAVTVEATLVRRRGVGYYLYSVTALDPRDYTDGEVAAGADSLYGGESLSDCHAWLAANGYAYVAGSDPDRWVRWGE